ncbi:unnamed protein product [Lymnaea stagnalis]|uniref:Transcobalamin-like C-terminal domain-containing protein n=1 Tax=Lymnaea stagnalis TaxID=6523 RepID=A0AAV2IIA1_LYMST
MLVVEILLLSLCLCLISSPLGLESKRCTLGDQCHFNQPMCGMCGKPINVTLKAKNRLQPPMFTITAILENVPQRQLLYFLEDAANQVSTFKFKTTYFSGLGYYIESINNVPASISNNTYWQINSGGIPLDCGVSNYVPECGETIFFNFTTYGDADHF